MKMKKIKFGEGENYTVSNMEIKAGIVLLLEIKKFQKIG